jgi:glycosyltransferase involved in cell wall biosynthesis
VAPPWFVLYRVADDPARAQTVQVVHTAWALARAGLEVTLPIEGRGAPLLADLGLEAPPGLRIVALGGRTAGSLRLRAALLAFLVRSRGRGVVACRHLRYAYGALSLGGRGVRLLYEAHEIARREAAAAGEDVAPWLHREALVLARARWLVTNAEGTLAALRRDHAVLPPARVCANAAQQRPAPVVPGRGVGVVGSVRPYKDPDTVADAALRLPGLLKWVGAEPLAAARLRHRSGGALEVEPPAPHHAIPARLASFETLLLPLSPGDEFGQALTSPLKLWDALQSGVPLVAADTPAVRAAAEGAYVPYTPGDVDSLVAALQLARDPAVRARVLATARQRARTWDDRARELVDFVR